MSTSEHLVQEWVESEPERSGFKVTKAGLRTVDHLFPSAPTVLCPGAESSCESRPLSKACILVWITPSSGGQGSWWQQPVTWLVKDYDILYSSG